MPSDNVIFTSGAAIASLMLWLHSIEFSRSLKRFLRTKRSAFSNLISPNRLMLVKQRAIKHFNVVLLVHWIGCPTALRQQRLQPDSSGNTQTCDRAIHQQIVTRFSHPLSPTGQGRGQTQIFTFRNRCFLSS